MLLRRAVLLLAAYACGSSNDADVGDLPPVPPSTNAAAPIADGGAADAAVEGPDVPYDSVLQKSSHNSFERHEPVLDQLLYHRIRSLELDIHVRREGKTAAPGDWFVYHHDDPFMRTTSCTMLADCGRQLAAFHAAVPKHEVVTLFVDLKEGFSAGHQPVDLDEAIGTALGRENVVGPSDLLAACPGAKNVREAVSGSCKFPTLSALRGKFVVAVTGGTACDPESLVSRYGGASPAERLAFAAPSVDSGCPVPSYDERPDVVFLNMSFDDRALAEQVRARGLVARVYTSGGNLGSPADFEAAKTARANHIATDKVSFEQDAWAVTHNAHGFPFSCKDCPASAAEVSPTVGVRATSGDVWAASDSFYFAYREDPGDATWSALVSVPSSHVEPFAKACLMARASEAPNAANVAVCRTFDEHPPRMQVRPSAGAATTATEAAAFPGVNGETAAFIRLKVAESGAGVEVEGQASADGVRWETIGKRSVDVPLPLRGTAVAAHGSASVKALFTSLKRDAKGPALEATALVNQKAIGAAASGAVFDGVFP